MNTAELTEKYILGNYGRIPVAFERGEGSRIWDETGREYLDFAGGIAVCSLGHCPPVLQRALARQAARLIHCSNLYQIREQALLGEFLVEKVIARPGKVFFCNSGAEANDGLIKLARKRARDTFGGTAGKTRIITCTASFHGRTLGGIAATGQDKVKAGFEPILPGFTHVPFNDCESLKAAVNEQTAAILVEAIQGEGGINVISPEFLETAAELREKFDLLLMFDEIQSGIGRTGDWCGWRSVLKHRNLEIEPDAVSWAKGLGGGFPIGAFWAGDHIQGHLGPGTHGSTFGGTPLASAVALAVLEEIDRIGALENAARQEQRIRDAVKQRESPLIKSVRGKGLMLGFVLDESAPQFQDAQQSPALFLVKELMGAGLLTVPAGSGVVRWLPALNVADSDVDRALEIFETTLGKIEE